MDKMVKRGYNEYIRLDEGIGKDAMMDVALLVMEDGDTWSCEEPEKEAAALVFDGSCTIKWENESYDVDRPNPFDYNPSCLRLQGRKVRDHRARSVQHLHPEDFERKDLPEQDVQAGRHRYLGTRQQGRAGWAASSVMYAPASILTTHRTPTWFWAKLSTCRASGPLTRRIIIRSRSATSTASTSRWASAQAGATARSTKLTTTASLSSPTRCTLR